jgi:adhesin transport system membrane fusion protein
MQQKVVIVRQQGPKSFWRRGLDRCYGWLSPRIDRAVNLAVPREPGEDADYDVEADWVIAEQTPHGSRLAVWLAFASITLLMLWAGFAKIDEVTKGEGKVIPSKQVQTLQSLDGGMIREVLVREGQLVEKNQVLLKIDPTRMVSSLRENQSQAVSLRAKAARLQALADGKPFVPPVDLPADTMSVVEQERALYESRKAEMEAAMGVAHQQYAQRAQELESVRAKRDQAARSFDLTNRELEMTRPLAKTGAVSDVELLRLERDVARFKGERDQSGADITRLQSAMAESSRKLQEVELEFRNQARTELSEVNAKLGALSEGSLALEDRVKQTEIRSPVRGTIKQIQSYTIGGVVQPGKDLVEIVPADDALLLEAKVAPRDIAFLRPGLKAMVKFTAYDFSIYGGLDAKLEHISADTVTDERGNAFYLVRVRTSSSHLGSQQLPIIPGMVAEVDILTGKKTILSYLMKPILRAKANSLTER